MGTTRVEFRDGQLEDRVRAALDLLATLEEMDAVSDVGGIAARLDELGWDVSAHSLRTLAAAIRAALSPSTEST